jgi:uncharacterized OB-fold protein
MVLVTVAFKEGLQIPGQLVGLDPDEVRIGEEVQTIVDVLFTTDDGQDMLTWKFRPVGSSADSKETAR